MDPATSDIRPVEFTPGRDGDSPVLPDLPGQIPAGAPIGTADGACDTRRCHVAITERQATPIIPIRRNGRAWNEDRLAARARNATPGLGVLDTMDRCPRQQPDRGRDALPEILRRASWPVAIVFRTSGVPMARPGLPTCLSFSRAPEPMAVARSVMNRFDARDTAGIVRVARRQRDKGNSRLRPG